MQRRISFSATVLMNQNQPYEYMEEYRKFSMVIHKKISYNKGNQIVNAVVLNIEDDGGLKVLNEDGTQEILRSGEITIRMK